MADLDERVQKLLLQSHFFEHAYSDFQMHSFKKLIHEKLQLILAEQRRVVIYSPERDELHTVAFESLRVQRPVHVEMDRASHPVVRRVYPAECRLRGLTYACNVLVDIVHRVQHVPRGDARFANAANLSPHLDYSDLPIKSQTVSLEQPCIQGLPVMVGSDACHLSDSPAQKEEERGDRHGYFIITGNERVIQPQEVLKHNATIVFQEDGEIEAQCRSRHELRYRSTSTFYVRYVRGALTCNIPFTERKQLPLSLLLRLFNVETLQEAESLVWGAAPAPTDPVDALRAALTATLPSVALHHLRRHGVEALTAWDLTPREVYGCVAVILNRSLGAEAILAERASESLDNLKSNELLPHLGLSNDPLTQRKKATYIARIMVRRCMRVYAGTERADDRDSYAHKRVQAVGFMLSIIVRQLLRKVVKLLRTSLTRCLASGKKIPPVHEMVPFDKLYRQVRYNFQTGNWTADKKRPNAMVGVSQMLQRHNMMAAMTHVMRFNNPLPRKGRAVDPRMPQNSHFGLICPNETPEGDACGLLKNFALCTHVRPGYDVRWVRRTLLRDLGDQVDSWCEDVEPFDDDALTSARSAPRDAPDALLLLNDDILGVLRVPPQEVAASLRAARRAGLLPYDMSIVVKSYGVCVIVDEGCLLRPLLRVDALHTVRPAIEALAKEHGVGVLSGVAAPDVMAKLWPALVRSGAIEYVDKEEELGGAMLTALTSEQLLASPQAFTHAEIHPVAMLGLCSSGIPLSNYNQSPRNAYQSSMGKQALGIAMSVMQYRLDSHAHVGLNLQVPICRSWAEEFLTNDGRLHPGGVNCVVAIMSWSGLNQEDSLVMSKALVDTGAFRSIHLSRVQVDECRNGNEAVAIEHPLQIAERLRNKKIADYSKLDESGIVCAGEHIVTGDVLIGMTRTVLRPDGSRDKSQKDDCSCLYDESLPAIVDRVMLTTNKEGLKSVRLVLRQLRVPMVGDKFASRSAQKGTIGYIAPMEDMPFSMSCPGLRPDIIINPHCMPSRMTIGHLLETALGKIGASCGQAIDATPFRGISLDDVKQALRLRGFQSHGHEVMVDGCTGEMLRSDVYMGVVSYNRLKHLVADKYHARTTGPINNLTRQPNGGRRDNGGLRMGEMERDALITHGAANVLRDRMLFASDNNMTPICPRCGSIGSNMFSRDYGATVRGRTPMCHACGEMCMLTAMPYAMTTLMREAEAMHIKMSVRVDGAPFVDPEVTRKRRAPAGAPTSESARPRATAAHPADHRDPRATAAHPDDPRATAAHPADPRASIDDAVCDIEPL